MDGGKIFKDSQVVVLGVCIAVATIVSSVILSQGFMKVMKFTKEVILVTGSAQKEIKSDYIVWKGSFARRQTDLPSGYKKLKEDLERVKIYLLSKGVEEEEIIPSQISTATIFKKSKEGKDTNEIEGYELSQVVEIRSTDVGRVDLISRDSTELINDGIQFISDAPRYFYTKLDQLKIEMLAKATENAKLRAESMAKSTGNNVGAIRSAKMGVFQITPVTSTDVSDWGENDTSSFDKKVMAVVSASFAIN